MKTLHKNFKQMEQVKLSHLHTFHHKTHNHTTNNTLRSLDTGHCTDINNGAGSYLQIHCM